jgi:hypothetical protein
MKERTVHWMKEIIHVVLFTVSAALSAGLFLSFSNDFNTQWLIYFPTAISFEVTKIYLLLLAKKNRKIIRELDRKGVVELQNKEKLTTKDTNRYKRKFAFNSSLFVSFATLSLIASAGFILLTIESKDVNIQLEQSADNFLLETYDAKIIELEDDIEGIDSDIEQLESDAAQIDSQIEVTQRQLDSVFADESLTPGQINWYVNTTNNKVNDLRSQKESITVRIDSLTEKQDQLIVEKDEQRILKQELLQQEAQEELANADNAADMFDLLGGVVSISGKNVMIILLIAFMLLLEISIATTSGEIKIKTESQLESKFTLWLKKIFYKKKEEIEKPKLTFDRLKYTTYIEALFDVDGSKRLNTNEKISEKTHIPINECKDIRSVLSRWKYNGEYLINSRQGGTMANFNKENMLKIVKFHIASEVQPEPEEN